MHNDGFVYFDDIRVYCPLSNQQHNEWHNHHYDNITSNDVIFMTSPLPWWHQQHHNNAGSVSTPQWQSVVNQYSYYITSMCHSDQEPRGSDQASIQTSHWTRVSVFISNGEKKRQRAPKPCQLYWYSILISEQVNEVGIHLSHLVRRPNEVSFFFTSSG